MPDRWVLSRLRRVTQAVAEALESYRFNDAAAGIYNFVWHEFCDWYLEAIKPALYEKEGPAKKKTTLGVLWCVMHDTLILLHPFMPFVTEEIWHKLPGTRGSIMKAAFPADQNKGAEIRFDTEAESQMTLLIELISSIRNIRGEMNISPSLNLAATVQTKDSKIKAAIEQYQDIIINLAKLDFLSVTENAERPKSSATAVVGGAAIFVPLEGIIDFGKEAQRLEKEINKLTKELATVSKKLENENFLGKAPEDVVQQVKAKHSLLQEKQQKLQSNLNKLKEIES
jgi:valyl-tRNA synthetase